MLVESRQAREILGALAQGLARALELGSEQAREHRHQQHRAGVHGPDGQHQRPRPGRAQRRRRQPARVRREQHHAVGEDGERRGGERAAALEEQRAVDRDQHEQEREHRVDAAREADEPAHDRDVGRDVDRREARLVAHPRQQQPVDGGRQEGEADGAPQPARLREAVADAHRVERDGDAEAHEREREARSHQDHEAPGQSGAGLRGGAARGLRIRARLRRLGHGGRGRQPIVSAILKIGRYIAISMPPTVPPRTDHHERLEHRGERLDRRVDLVVVEVRDLREHALHRAGLFADRDHLHHHAREDAGLAERLGDGLALRDRGPDVVERVLDDHVAGRLARRCRGRRGSARRSRSWCRACA